MTASLTNLPVLGVPVKSKALQGVDSLLSIVQMPAGIPTATFAVGEAGATNAALFAISMLAANGDSMLKEKLNNFREQQKLKIETSESPRLKISMNPGDNKWVGVMGGGQLGRMLSLDARRMGLKVLAWTGGDRSGAASTADELLDDSFESQTALEKFCNKVNVATVEFENLPAKTLQEVEKRITLYPNSRTISICQHREKEKQFLSKNGFNCVKFKIAHDIDSFKDGIKALEYHAIVKTAEFGYDGKGQIKISKQLTEEEISNIWKTFEGGRVVIEELISLKAELSVLVVRNVKGEIKTYDPAENIHRDLSLMYR